MARATSSLPVPDSPVTRIVLLVGATVSTRSNTSCMALLRPMMFENADEERSARLSSTFSWRSVRRSSALRTFAFSSSTSNGFVR